MNKIRDMTGRVFGYLTILRREGSVRAGQTWIATWAARCVCGATVVVRGSYLRATNRGPKKSCGCRRGEMLTDAWGTHGMTGHPAWNSWSGMRQRCGNPQGKDWTNYGGRGITVCERWQESFENFWADMGPTYVKGRSIDRRDNALGYTPENCRWATPPVQGNNTRVNRIIDTPRGAMTVKQAAAAFGLTYVTLHARIFRYGYSVEKALTRPVRRRSTTSERPAPETVL